MSDSPRFFEAPDSGARSRSVHEERQLRIAAALARVGLELSRSLDVDHVTATVTRLAAEVFRGWGLLDLWQPDGSLRRAAATHHRPELQEVLEEVRRQPYTTKLLPGRSESYTSQVARTGRPVIGELDLDQVIATSPPGLAEVHRLLRPRYLMAVPVEFATRRLGALTVVRPDDEQPFGPDDPTLLVQFAERAAIALAHATDFSEQRRAALALQRSLLPNDRAVPPGLQLAVRYRAATTGAEVGGDWYDTVDLGNGAIGIAVGDVEGHDITAAAVMAQVRAIVHSHARAGMPPGRIAAEANRFLIDSSYDRLVTFIYLQLHPADRLAVCVRAGHLPAVTAHPGGRAGSLTGRGGLPLGVDPAGRWEEETVMLSAGTVMALFTDGLVEAPSRPLDSGLRQLSELIERGVADPLEDLADRLLELMAGPSAVDDVALVLLRLPDPDHSRDLELRRQLPASPSSASVARQFVGDLLRSRAVSRAVIDDSLLLLTELVSNASRHSDDSIEIRVRTDNDQLRIGVFDDSHRLPRLARTTAEDTSGRGLHLVNALARSWGVDVEDNGKVVWFEMSTA